MPVAGVLVVLGMLVLGVVLGIVMLGVVALGVLVTPVVGVAVAGVVGSAMLPFDVVVVTPLVLLRDVSDGAVFCCAAAGTAIAVMSTAAIVFRYDMSLVAPACGEGGFRSSRDRLADILTHSADTVHAERRIVIFPYENPGQ